MTAQHLEEVWAKTLVEATIAVLWDEKPKTALEIARELQNRFPNDFFDMPTDRLAQDVDFYVTAKAYAKGLFGMTDDNKYYLSDVLKERGMRNFIERGNKE